MRAFYLIYATDNDDVIPEVEAVLGRLLTDVATLKSETPEFLDVIHSWEKYGGWDWLKEMPRANSARFAITGGFGEVPLRVASGLIDKINEQTGLENSARLQTVFVGVKGKPTVFNVPTYWGLA
jgi:hypothetical protein